MKIKFQADADFNQYIVSAVRRHNPAIDFQSADEAGIRGLSDPALLAFAANEGRLLVSHDCNTMPAHFAEFVASQHSSGVFMVAQDVAIGLVAEEIILIWETSEADEWIDVLEWLPL